MPVLLIRIDTPPGGGSVAVRGFTITRTDTSWKEEEGASCSWPADQPVFDQARDAVLSSGDSSQPARQVGYALWDLVAGSTVGQWWKSAVDKAEDATVRTVLDIRAEELQSVPWELMCPRNGSPLFRSEQHPWVRAGTPLQPLDEMPVPVRMLMVVGDTRSKDLDVDAEIAAVHGALRGVPGKWLVETLVERDITDLRQTLKEVRPHVLHVIAHGMSLADGQVIAMHTRDGSRWPLNAQDVAEFPKPLPRLVVLNACRTGAEDAGRQASWTFTKAFLDGGAAAVVAMQGDIPSKAAVPFSETLYAELARGSAIDVATALGRLRINDVLRTNRQADDRTWALPCLTVAADPDRVLPVRISMEDEERLKAPPMSDVFAPVPCFVDRSSERRQLWRDLDPEPGETGRRLVLVSGDAQVGKSAVVLSALMTLRLRGRNVVYADLSGASSTELTWLGVLRTIREALFTWVPDSPGEPKRRFDHEVYYLTRYREPPKWPAAEPKQDDGREFVPQGGEYFVRRGDGDDPPGGYEAAGYQQWVRRVFARFLWMLQEVAKDSPLLLVLDSLGSAYGPDVSQFVAPHLLEPIGRGLPADVSCVVVGTDQELNSLTPGVRRAAGQALQVGPFEPGDLVRLAREFYARQAIPVTDRWWPPTQNYLSAAGKGWGASRLQYILSNTEWLGGPG